MGRELRIWARSQPKHSHRYPDGVTNTERDVLTEMCDRVDPSRGGFFYIRLSHFQQESFHNMAPRTLRGHVTSLVNKGYLIITHRGTGPVGTNLRFSRSHYYINAGALVPALPPQPEQLKLAMLTLIRTEDANNQHQYRTQNRPRLDESLGRSEEVLAQNRPRPEEVLAENRPTLEKVLAENPPTNQRSLGGFSAKTTPHPLLENKEGLTKENEVEERSMHAARELSAKSSSRLGSSRSNFDPSWSPYLDELVGDLNEPLEITPPLTTSEMLAMLSDELVVPSMTPDNLASVIINNLAVRTDHIQNIDFFVRSRVEMASKGTLRFGERTLPRTYKKPSVDWHSPSPTRAVSMI